MRSRRFILFFLMVLALFGGLYSGRELLFQLTYLLGLVLLLSFVWAWSSLRYVNFSRLTRTRRTQVGRPLEERFRIVNSSFLPKLWLEVRDFSNVPAHQASYVINGMGSHSSETWRVQTICQQRGRYHLGPMTLRTSDPFGLFTLEKALDVTTNVVVYPMTVDVHAFALPQGILPGGEAIRRRTHYVTTNASGVREYAPGDSFNRIHWRSTARRSRLIVKEFELDPLADIWILPDMAVYEHIFRERPEAGFALEPGNIPAVLRREAFKLPSSTEEYTVTVAASLAQFFLRQDRSVGMVAAGQVTEILQPDRGERQLNRVLETLSVIRAEGTLYIEDLILAELRFFPRGSTIIVITPTTRPGWATAARQLRQRGMRVVTVLIDPRSFGGRKSADSLVPLLQQRGMGTYVIRDGDDLTGVLSTPGLGTSF